MHSETLNRLQRSLIRTAFKRISYPWIVKKQARNDRETAHKIFVRNLDRFSHGIERAQNLFWYENPVSKTKWAGLEFNSPYGTAAGFLKDADGFHTYSLTGTSYTKLGSITKDQYPGNPNYPRIVALPEDLGLANWMSYPNEGAEYNAEVIRRDLPPRAERPYLLGASVAVSQDSFDSAQKETPVNRRKILDDLHSAYTTLFDSGVDFIETGMSSPNTAGVIGFFEDPEILEEVADMQLDYQKNKPTRRPLIWKLSVNTPFTTLSKMLGVMMDKKIDAVCFGNTVKIADIENQLPAEFQGLTGGYSGPLATERMLQGTDFIARETGGKLPIFLSGGMGYDGIKSIIRAHLLGATFIDLLTPLVRRRTAQPFFFYDLNEQIARFIQLLNTPEIKKVSDIATTDKKLRANIMHNLDTLLN